MGYIAINNYTKKIKKRTILDNINLTVDKGKIYGLVGKNVCGKNCGSANSKSCVLSFPAS